MNMKAWQPESEALLPAGTPSSPAPFLTTTNMKTNKQPVTANADASGVGVQRLVHPWPDYDETAAPEENETMYLHYLTEFANEETTCLEIADQLNAKFGHNRTEDDVLCHLWTWQSAG